MMVLESRSLSLNCAFLNALLEFIRRDAELRELLARSECLAGLGVRPIHIRGKKVVTLLAALSRSVFEEKFAATIKTQTIAHRRFADNETRYLTHDFRIIRQRLTVERYGRELFANFRDKLSPLTGKLAKDFRLGKARICLDTHAEQSLLLTRSPLFIGQGIFRRARYFCVRGSLDTAPLSFKSFDFFADRFELLLEGLRHAVDKSVNLRLSLLILLVRRRFFFAFVKRPAHRVALFLAFQLLRYSFLLVYSLSTFVI